MSIPLGVFIIILCSLQTFYGRRPQGLNGALREVGIEFEGREHSGEILNCCLTTYYIPLP